jgi:hypothetical protein
MVDGAARQVFQEHRHGGIQAVVHLEDGLRRQLADFRMAGHRNGLPGQGVEGQPLGIRHRRQFAPQARLDEHVQRAVEQEGRGAVVQGHHQFRHARLGVTQLADLADVSGHAFQGLGAGFRSGHEPAVAPQRPGRRLHGDVRCLVGQDVVPGRLRVATAQADDMMIPAFLPGHLGLGGEVFREIGPFLAHGEAGIRGYPVQVRTHAGQGFFPASVGQLPGDVQPEIARGPEHLVRARVLMLGAAEQCGEFVPGLVETPFHGQRVGQPVAGVGEVGLQLQGLAEPVPCACQVAFLRGDAPQRVHGPGIRRVQCLGLPQQRFGSFDLAGLLDQLVAQHDIGPGIPGIQQRGFDQVFARLLWLVELHIGHSQVAVCRDNRRIQFEHPVEDADGFTVVSLPAALHAFLEETHGLGVHGFGDRLELDDQDAFTDGKVGPLEQARFIRTNTLDDLLLRQRGQVGRVEKLEVG